MKMPILLSDDDLEHLGDDSRDVDEDVEDDSDEISKGASSVKSCWRRFRQSCREGIRWIVEKFEPDPNLVPDEPDFYTMAFDRNRKDIFRIESEDTFFSSAQRSRLVYDVLARAAFNQDKVSRRHRQQ